MVDEPAALLTMRRRLIVLDLFSKSGVRSTHFLILRV
jgi:hypothetical protein